MTSFAHSTQRPDRSDWQILADHLLDTGSRASIHASAFGGQVLADTAGRLHDLGKYTQRFQRRLDGDPTRVDHSTWGARIARDRLGTALKWGLTLHI